MALTSEAKKLLAETIRGTAQDPEKGLRARLLQAIHNEADRRYRLSVAIEHAGLDEAHRRRRRRIEAWIDERARAARPKNKAELKVASDRLLALAEKEAAATLVNRLVLLRQLEALGLFRPAVVTGGWSSKAYREFREFAPTLCANGTSDPTEGYATLLQLVFDELATDLPGLFGDVGLTRLFPIPAAALRDVVERFDNPDLASAWTDDTTLGWVYQYWNDPDREALDAKIASGGKIEPHEIASKTQMFTERYMVEWLLQNSLGHTWLSMCKKRGWKADAEAILPALEARRAEWRQKRDVGEVALDALMPIHGALEEQWKYYVPQPIPDDAVAHAPDSVRAIKLLDPACGSGHFLVIGFDLLAALYREEARHRGQSISEKDIAESIIENNLHGIDIDPRAIQIAAAGLYLKAKSASKAARLKRVNLVAPVLQLGNLPADDPAVIALRNDLKREVGLPEELTNKLLSSLAGVDHLGSLLKVDAAVDEALRAAEVEVEKKQTQGDLFGGFAAEQVKLPMGEKRASVLDKLEQFLSKRSGGDDLGLRLGGEQLAAGIRFVRLAREGTYDVVVGNPPYQGLSKTSALGYVAATYPKGKADLYAAFLERGLQLVRPLGVSALITIRGWMFLGQFAALRHAIIRENSLVLGDLGWGAFEQMTDNPVTMSATCRGNVGTCCAISPVDPTARVRTDEHRSAITAGLLAQVGRHEFDPRGFEAIEGEPIVYWWTRDFLSQYAVAPKLGELAPVRLGLSTSNNPRFVRQVWEVRAGETCRKDGNVLRTYTQPQGWRPLVSGASGTSWVAPLTSLVRFANDGLELRCAPGGLIRNPDSFMQGGVAFTPIGNSFSARAHRYRSMFDAVGRSVITSDVPRFLANMNTAVGRFVMESLNPTVSFTAGDVARIPILPTLNADDVFACVESAFTEQESVREPSVEFRRPGPSAWEYAQSWAQTAVDRPENTPLPPYEPTFEPPTPTSFVSFAIGVALGRFGANGEGILTTPPDSALPAGILFVSTEGADSLDHPACALLANAWKEHGASVGQGDDLRTYLRKSFFDYHKKLYENRPIYFPLSSAKKSFMAFASIHRWTDGTLNALLADHLMPTKRRLEGELDDLRVAKTQGPNKGKAEKRYGEVQKALEELYDFIAKVTEIAEKGPPAPDNKTEKREADAPYRMDLDDGVMVNSAALWPLLDAQWKDPKKWWKELACAQGKKDYDWSHLAARYFPTRVRAKCHSDPSLGVAHTCFWELHPAKAYAWELRLQDEIRPDFMIEEPNSTEARERFLKEHDREAREILAKELKRREKKNQREDDESSAGPLFDQTDDTEDNDA
ncbi:MAG: BREX-6 system adenine-specific DNA-methyltransferase PglX [Polyangiaceae bacterium]|nr:BREX-6 system adenine-specific DNA-methyltransferase PglX [Polyangiaceae bacterium]